jgi:hypothetical protein
MMPFPRRWLDRWAVVGLATSVLGCFTDAPPLEDDTGSTSRADGTGAEADATGSPTTSMDDDDGPVDDSGDTTTGGSSDDSTPDAEAEVDTGSVECDCPVDALLCEDFESDLEEWSPPAGAVLPTIASDVVHCGNGALHTELPAEGDRSTIGIELTSPEASQSAWSFGGWYLLEGGCLQEEPIRFVRVWFGGGGGDSLYRIDLVIDAQWLRLLAYTPEIENEGSLMRFPTDEWVEFRIDFDLSQADAPQVSATIDGNAVTVAAPAVPTIADHRVYPTLGPFRNDGPQTDVPTCVVTYDHVWFGPTP